MERIAQSLSQEYDVHWIGRCYADSPPLTDKPFVRHRLRCIFRKGKAFYIEYHLRLFLYLLFNRKFDVYSAVDLDTLIPCYLVARLRGSKVVMDAHEWFPEVPEVERRPIIRAIWLWVERTFVPRLDRMYTVSSSIADHYSRQYGISVDTIRNVPDASAPTDHQFLAPVQGPFILYQGAVNEGRGLEQLVMAAPGLPFPVVIAGDGDVLPSLQEMAGRLPDPRTVIFTGRLTPAELRSLTAKAWLGVNLLESRSKSYFYSLANKFFDYPSAGIPQLCMQFPEYEKVNSEVEVAVLLEDIKPESIQQAVTNLLKDTHLYSKLQQNCLQFRKVYTWDEEQNKLLRTYEQLFR